MAAALTCSAKPMSVRMAAASRCSATCSNSADRPTLHRGLAEPVNANRIDLVIVVVP